MEKEGMIVPYEQNNRNRHEKTNKNFPKFIRSDAFEPQVHQRQFISNALAKVFPVIFNLCITMWMWITVKQTDTTGLRNSWIAMLIGMLAGTLHHNSIDCSTSGFGMLCSFVKLPMVVFAIIGSLIVYNGWRDRFDQNPENIDECTSPCTCKFLCKKKMNALSYISPIISFMSFVAFMFTMGVLLGMNAITFNSIGYIGGGYAALEIGNIAIVSSLKGKTRRNFVKKLTKIGGRIAVGILLTMPVVYSYYLDSIM